MGGTNRPNGSSGQIKVTAAASGKISAPMAQESGSKGTVVRGGDLRTRGNKK